MIARPIARLALMAGAASLLAIPFPAAQAQSSNELSGLLRDTEIEETLHADADPIFLAAGLTPRNITIALIGDKELNAFTTNGRFMGLNTGLILQTKTPNELKGVIAHETGHIAGGHSVRANEAIMAGLKPMLLTLGLAAAAMMSGSSDSTDAAMTIASGAPMNAQIGVLAFSREQEARADQAAVNFLEKTGQSGQGLVSFFDNFRYEEVFSKARQYAFFQDHPLSSDRIDLLRSRVEAQPHYKVVDTPADIARHEMMKAKIDGFMNPRQALNKYKATDTALSARYARAIAYYQTRAPDQALTILDGMLSEQPDNAYFWELKGQILFEFNHAAEAEVAQRRSVALKPDAPLLLLNLGQTLITQEDPAKRSEGIEVLKRALTYEDDNTLGWRLLSRAYNRAGEQGLSLWASAEEFYAAGETRRASGFAAQARAKLPQNSSEWRRATDILTADRPKPGGRS